MLNFDFFGKPYFGDIEPFVIEKLFWNKLPNRTS